MMGGRQTLFAAAERLGIPLAAHEAGLLLRYAAEIERWNKFAGLVGPGAVNDLLSQHIVDGLALLRHEPVRSAGRIVDVGSGGGLPGVVLAIVLSRADVALLEANGRKVRFLEHLRAELGLEYRVLAGRAEEFARQDEHRGAYDAAVSRALAEMNILCEYCLPFLKTGGHMVAMKGPGYEEELSQAARAISLLGGRPGDVQGYSLDGRQRFLVDIVKERPTPDGYPRRPGVPSRKPL